jgi:hypothetical protein
LPDPVEMLQVSPKEAPSFFEKYLLPIILTVIGGIMIAYIIQADRFAPKPLLSNTAPLSPQQIALTPQPSNTAWQPYITERDFGDGIPMCWFQQAVFQWEVKTVKLTSDQYMRYG